MGGISESDYRAMLLRVEQNRKPLSPSDLSLQPIIPPHKATKAECESDLQDEIEKVCRGKGWWVGRSRMDKRTTRPVGEADLTILQDDGKHLLIECKRADGGKLSPKQQETGAWMRKLKQPYFVVTSIEEFMAVLQEQKSHAKDHNPV